MSIPVILPANVEVGDQDYFSQAPAQADVGLAMAKDPATGSFIAMCALPGMFDAGGGSKLGYLALQKRTAGVPGTTAASKIRVLTADHPDGG